MPWEMVRRRKLQSVTEPRVTCSIAMSGRTAYAQMMITMRLPPEWFTPGKRVMIWAGVDDEFGWIKITPKITVGDSFTVGHVTAHKDSLVVGQVRMSALECVKKMRRQAIECQHKVDGDALYIRLPADWLVPQERVTLPPNMLDDMMADLGRVAPPQVGNTIPDLITPVQVPMPPLADLVAPAPAPPNPAIVLEPKRPAAPPAAKRGPAPIALPAAKRAKRDSQGRYVADFTAVQDWAVQRGVMFAHWDDLEKVNAKAARVGHPGFSPPGAA